MTDYPIYINGAVVSANQHRQRERIERKLRELEAEVAEIQFQLEQEQKRDDELHHRARMFELHSILAHLRNKAMGVSRNTIRGGGTPGLIYKVKYNARIR